MGKLLLLGALAWLAIAAIHNFEMDQRIALTLLMPVMFVVAVFLAAD